MIPARATLTFAVPGDVLSTTAAALRRQIAALLEASAGSPPLGVLEIDLRTARMVDSVGLNLLVWAWKSAQARGAQLRVRLASPDIQRTLRFTRLTSYIEVVNESGQE